MSELAPPEVSRSIQAGFEAALQEARKFVGATAPNPPVGAAALDAEGRLLGVAAHQKAGTEHAEARLIRELTASGDISSTRTLLVTLEPCNHYGRTPPCSQAILAHPQIQQVWMGELDPNPRVDGGGRTALLQAGRKVHALPAGSALQLECSRLIAPFRKWSTTGMPWVVVKSAHRFESIQARDAAAQDLDGLWRDDFRLRVSMTPPAGSVTFTSEDSLRDAHIIRRESDAILTGSGTVLADNPSFTVRKVPDHVGRERLLVLMDRRMRIPQSWCDAAESRGFKVLRAPAAWSFDQLLQNLAQQGVLQVLVEAGPDLSSEVLQTGLFDEHVAFLSASDVPDLKQVRRNFRS